MSFDTLSILCAVAPTIYYRGRNGYWLIFEDAREATISLSEIAAGNAKPKHSVVSLLASGNLPGTVFGQSLSCPGIHVKVLNIRNRNGTVDCALFDSPAGFPREFLHSGQNVMVIKVRNTAARCDFEAIPAGTYALAVIHDENSNGKLDSNLLGIPTEGYGFSNDAKALIGTPSFSAAAFPYNGQTLDLTINLHY